MSHKISFTFIFFFSVLIFSCETQSFTSIEEIKQQFKNPPENYRPVVYWFWNGDIDYDSIKSQLEKMKQSNTVSAVCVMGWEGLTMEYLSDEWFDKVKYACKIAKEVGLDIWLYDEHRWPSGHAGGKVLDGNPEYQAKCLKRRVMDVEGSEEIILPLDSLIVSVLAWQSNLNNLKTESIIDLTKISEDDKIVWKVPNGHWTINVFEVEQCTFTTTFTDLNYVDLLDSAAVNKFISITNDEYYKRMSEYFGSVIKAVITDEPGLYCDLKPFLLNPGSLPWTFDFLEEF